MSERSLQSWYRDPIAWLIGTLGLGVRLAWVGFAMRPPHALADPALYLYSALQLACGKGYVALSGPPCVAGAHPARTSYYPPGYPVFLGGVHWLLKAVGLSQHHLGITGIVQAAMGGVAVLAVFIAGRRLGGRPVGIAAALVFALWPNLIIYTGLLLSETLFTTALAVSLAALLTINDPGRWRWGRAAVAGLAFGLATMVRPQLLLTVPALALAWSLSRVGWRQVLARSAVMVIGVIAFAAPWTLRNYSVFGTFVPFSTNGGDNLCLGFHPGATGGFSIPKYCDTGDFYTGGPKAELRRDAATRHLAIKWLTSHPGELPALSAKKMWLTYRSDTDGLYAAVSFGEDQFLGRHYATWQHIADFGWGVVLAGSSVGLVLTAFRGWRRRRRDPAGLVIVFGTLAGLVVPVLFFGDPRFKLAVAPFLAVLAGVTFAIPWAWPDPEVNLVDEPDAADVLEEVALTGQVPVVKVD